MTLVALVTGGSGFIGSHVVDSLLDKGFSVRVFDKAKPLHEKVDWFRGDLLSKEDLNQAVKDAEIVFHLAAVADVNVATVDPQLCLDVNECGTLNLLRACSGSEVERIVLASTVWVYGGGKDMVNEETSIPPPGDLYTKTKIGQEHLVYSLSRSYSLPYTILRYDIPYGPRMRGNMAIAIFTRKAIKGEPITMFGDGTQGRCWVFITDLAEATCLATNKASRDQIINIAGREFVTISEIVDILSEIVGSFPVKREPARQGDFCGVRTSIVKAHELLGWSPRTTFRDGLLRYVENVRVL